MKKMYNSLFKEIVNSYYNNTFDETLKDILSDSNVNKIELANVISALCGVDVNYSDSFISDLKVAIKNYSQKHKIVQKVRNCSMECSSDSEKSFCQKSCPFDAIIAKDGSTYIDKFKCTDCGFCVDACPKGSILDKVEFLPLVDLLKSDVPVIAAVAPAISGQFGHSVTLDHLRTAFRELGFTDMIEVAFFADMLTLKEAVEFDHFVNSKEDLVITSCCCPMWVGMVKRIYSDLAKYVTPSVSPMIAAGRVMKKLHPGCKVVFIGPCVAKKAEAKSPDLIGDIDFVLTFEELKTIFDLFDIVPSKLSPTLTTEYASKGGRLYARTGGVSIAVKDVVESLYPEKALLFNSVQGNGVAECKKLLDKANLKEIEANFIEGMGCVGGCVGGPKALLSVSEGTEHVNSVAYSSEIKVPIHSSCMDVILEKIDIYSIDDFKDSNKTEIFHRDFN